MKEYYYNEMDKDIQWIIILSLFATKLYLFLIDLLVQKNVLNNNEIQLYKYII